MPATPFPRFLFRWIIIPMMLLGGCSSLETPTPRSALNYFRDGNTAYQKRDYPTAIWNYRQAIVLDDETPSFYYNLGFCLLYTSPSPRDRTRSRMPSSA